MLRFLTCGESHGPMLISMLDGFPAGLELNINRLDDELARRQKGYGRGSRQKIEQDRVHFVGGVRHGTTTGAPIGVRIENRDWQNWNTVMSQEAIDMGDVDVLEKLEKKNIKHFRPGHADLAGTIKYGHEDIRNVLERASARETASRVALGSICRQLLERFDIKVVSHVLAVGNVKADLTDMPETIDALEAAVENSELSCANDASTEAMKEHIKKAWQDGDSLGGVIEVIAEGLPVGLGDYSQWDRKLDGKLAQALMSIQAMKAVEIGDGFSGAAKPGSQVHDPIYPNSEDGKLPFQRKTNHAGGLEGGMTNGERLVVKVYMKPIPTLRKGLDSVSYPEFEAHKADYERSDVCAISAASVVARAMVSYVLADAFLDKFGRDSVNDIEFAYDNYRTQWQYDSSFDGCP